MSQKIDDLVNEAIQLDLPKCCTCCQLRV